MSTTSMHSARHPTGDGLVHIIFFLVEDVFEIAVLLARLLFDGDPTCLSFLLPCKTIRLLASTAIPLHVSQTVSIHEPHWFRC
jgi:hypothetical protein